MCIQQCYCIQNHACCHSYENINSIDWYDTTHIHNTQQVGIHVLQSRESTWSQSSKSRFWSRQTSPTSSWAMEVNEHHPKASLSTDGSQGQGTLWGWFESLEERHSTVVLVSQLDRWLTLWPVVPSRLQAHTHVLNRTNTRIKCRLCKHIYHHLLTKRGHPLREMS